MQEFKFHINIRYCNDEDIVLYLFGMHWHKIFLNHFQIHNVDIEEFISLKQKNVVA